MELPACMGKKQIPFGKLIKSKITQEIIDKIIICCCWKEATLLLHGCNVANMPPESSSWCHYLCKNNSSDAWPANSQVRLRNHSSDSSRSCMFFIFSPPESRQFLGLLPKQLLNEHSNHFVIHFNWKLMDWRDLICSSPGKHEVNNLTGIWLLQIAD